MKKFYYESETTWRGEYVTITKVFADIPQAAQNAIAAAENWDGCHWDAPNIIYSEQVEGQVMSDEASLLIKLLGATALEEEEEICS